jgi:hypothetical protein
MFFSPSSKLPKQNSVGKTYSKLSENLDHKFLEKVYFSEVSFGLNLIFFEKNKTTAFFTINAVILGQKCFFFELA